MKQLFLSICMVSALLYTGCKEEDDDQHVNLFVVDETNFKGNIPSGDEITLDATKTYKLTGALIVKEGAILTIPAGTVISATATTNTDIDVRYIAVERGAKININGSETKPVVLTSDVKKASSWGGLVVCGNGITNVGTDIAAEVSSLMYGGTNNADNSGVIKYLRLEYTGYKYSETKEFNGLSMFGVGSGTTVEYVVSYKGGDDGIEFFGGAVNGKYLVSVDSEDDGIDFADGWVGTGENWFVYNSSKSGIEGSNNGNDGAKEPFTNATLKNLTVYGMGEKPFYMKEGAGKMTVDNIVIGGLATAKAQAYFYADKSSTDPTKNDANTLARVAAGDIKITNVKFANDLASGQTKAITELTITESTTATGAGNGISKPSWLPDALNKVNATTNVIN